MAKKKRKSTSGRRRRVGAIKGGDAIKTMLIAGAGSIAAGLLSKMVVKQMPTVKPVMIGAGTAVLGFILSSRSNPMLKGLGLGMGVFGVNALVQTTGILSGIGAANDVTFRAMPPARQPSLIGRGVGRNAQNSPQASVINGLGRNAQNSPQASVIGSGNRTSVYGMLNSAI